MNGEVWTWFERVLWALAAMFAIAHWDAATSPLFGVAVVLAALALDRLKVNFPFYGYTSAAGPWLLAAACVPQVGVGFSAAGLVLTGVLRLNVSADLLPAALTLAALATGKLTALPAAALYGLLTLLHPLLRSSFFPRLSGDLVKRTWAFHLVGAALIALSRPEPLALAAQAVALLGAMGLVRSQRGMNLEAAHQQEARQLKAEQMKDYLLLLDTLSYSLHHQAEPQEVLKRVTDIMVETGRATHYALMERDGPRWRLVAQRGIAESQAVAGFQRLSKDLPKEAKAIKLKKGWSGEESALVLPWEGEGAIYLGRKEGRLESVGLLERLARTGAAALRTAHEKQQRRELGDYKSELERLYAELKATHAELEQSQSDLLQAKKLAAVGQLAAGVAHELNSPFQAIAVHLDLVKTSLEDPDDLECVDTIAEALERCRVIVKELLHFSRRSDTPPKQLDLAKVLQSACVAAGTAKVAVSGAEGLTLLGQEHEMVSLFTNLLGNARDAVASARPGEDPQAYIRVVAAQDASSLRVTVEDRGCGMTAEVQERVFEPFYTTKEVGSGTGLGMYLVYTYVSNAGGEIEVKSEPGQGTAVSVVFQKTDRPA